MSAAGWAVVAPTMPYTAEHVDGLVACEQQAALLNYRTGWHALAACHINPDNPHDWFYLAAAAQNMAALFPTIEHQAFALTVAKMVSDVSGGALWLN